MSSSKQPESVVQPLGSAAQDARCAIDQYQVAGPARRLAAAVLDLICLFLTGFVVGLIFGFFGIMPDPNVMNLTSIGVMFAYFWYFWTHQDGQTPGKRTLGIRVIRVDGQPIGTLTALIRFVGLLIGLALLDSLFVGYLVLANQSGWMVQLSGALAVGFLFVSWLVILVNHRGWHDRLAGTMVVMDRPARVPAMAPLPDGPPPDLFRPARAHVPVEKPASKSSYSSILLIVCVAAGIVMGYTLYYGTPPWSAPSSQTFTSGGVTVSVPGGWRTQTDFSDEAFCDDLDVECLFVAGPSPDVFFEVVRFKYGFLFSPTAEQFDEEFWAAIQQQNPQIELESRQELQVDGRKAIQRIYTDGEKTYLALFIGEEGNILRVWANGTSSSFEQYRQDLNASIDSLQFTSDQNE